ncbi:MAG: tRNA dihydrouridine synthase DusB [Pseudomonadales bacterium]|nr:tRNA dihydrouridine synthase DusB [Pseudomonadales bacterium]
MLGSWLIHVPLWVAPMAGVTDKPWRDLCRKLGAGMAVGEMLTSDARLWDSHKSSQRRVDLDETSPRVVQIVGYDPVMMADAARRQVDEGADIIDINMGCPAKKICLRSAGSALLQDPDLVRRILEQVVGAVSVPVTLKTRTGWSPALKNGPLIARIAEDSGIAGLIVHGRTRADRFAGHAEYDTLALMKQQIRIPLIANGDIKTPEKAIEVLAHTGADGIMIGRGALGRPWVFTRFYERLVLGQSFQEPGEQQRWSIMLDHVKSLHNHHGEVTGLRFARKHVGWYAGHRPDGTQLRNLFNTIDSCKEQCDFLEQFQDLLSARKGQRGESHECRDFSSN